jgi:hypothetical protein
MIGREPEQTNKTAYQLATIKESIIDHINDVSGMDKNR